MSRTGSCGNSRGFGTIAGGGGNTPYCSINVFTFKSLFIRKTGEFFLRHAKELGGIFTAAGFTAPGNDVAGEGPL